MKNHTKTISRRNLLQLAGGAAALGATALTVKADKNKAAEMRKVEERTKAALARHAAAFPEILTTSSEKFEGLERVRAAAASARREASRATSTSPTSSSTRGRAAPCR